MMSRLKKSSAFNKKKKLPLLTASLNEINSAFSKI